MSAAAEEILHALAVIEHDIHARIREVNEKLDRALVLLHAIERDAKPTETPPTRK